MCRSFANGQGVLNQVKIEFDDDVQVVSDKDFTLEDVRLTLRRDWDVLSYDERKSAFVKV